MKWLVFSNAMQCMQNALLLKGLHSIIISIPGFSDQEQQQQKQQQQAEGKGKEKPKPIRHSPFCHSSRKSNGKVLIRFRSPMNELTSEKPVFPTESWPWVCTCSSFFYFSEREAWPDMRRDA